VIVADEEVRLQASLTDDMSAALARIEQRIKSVEDAIDDLGTHSAASAKVGGKGFSDFGDKVAKAGRQAEDAQRPIKGAGDEAATSGAKAEAGSKGFDDLTKKLDKTSKKAGGLGSIFASYKWAGIITGVYALVGGISALGAGAVIAIGGLAPMGAAAAGILPIFAAAKLSMLLFTLAANQLAPTLTSIKNQFIGLGPVIAGGGLQKGLDYLSKSLGGLAGVTGKGLAGIGAEIGGTATYVGNLVKSAPFLAQVSAIFAGLRPIVADISRGLVSVGQILLDVLQAALPVSQQAASDFRGIADAVQVWTRAQLNNGNLTRWIVQGWQLFIKVVGDATNLAIGVFNIFRIGAGYSSQLGGSLEDLAMRFRIWTQSAQGQQQISQYFANSLPALREMGRLIGLLAGGLGHLGASSNVAPLLQQINNELLPAFFNAANSLTGNNGLGPALINVATQFLKLFSSMDFSSLTLFAQAIANVISGLNWMMQNVPGVSLLVSGLSLAMLGWKVGALALGPISSGMKAFAWVRDAAKGAEDLSIAQKAIGPGLRTIGDLFSGLGGTIGKVVIPAIRSIATAGVGALGELSTALVTTPVGWIILAIMAVIGVILLLWFKCAWFRDAVKAVWQAIATAAVAAWDWIKNAAVAVADWFVKAWQNTVSVFQTIIRAIVAAAQWIWTNGIKPVIDVILAVWSVVWSVIKFIVQTEIYIIVGIITLIAIAAKAVWDAIVAVAQWAWSNVLQPIFQLISSVASAVWGAISTAAQTCWNAIVAAVQWFWGLVQTYFQAWAIAGQFVWSLIVSAAQWCWGIIQGVINWFWGWAGPIFGAVGNAGASIWGAISSAAQWAWGLIQSGWSAVAGVLSSIWSGISAAGTDVWNGIKTVATGVADVVRGAWDTVTGAVKGAWNFIARGWNSIPDIHVPDWVPGIGGHDFGLPKLPTLWHGGPTPGGAALVGEHGPEPLVRGGRFVGMVGQHGPEVRTLPSGGYVVPNLSTLAALPGLARTIPSGVASAVARSVPGYAPVVSGGGGAAGTAELAHAVSRLAAAVRAERPPIVVNGTENVYREVASAMRTIRREDRLTSRYHYGD
jgi:phage-related protein